MPSESLSRPGKFLKEQWKKMTFFSGDVPTTEELELLHENRKRVALVIRARWILLAILSMYGLVVHIFFLHESADVESLTYVHLIAPFAAVLFVAAYNAFFQYSYQWFVQIRSLNQVQLLFDLLVVTVMVHYSGGAVSWFWTTYIVLTLEAALIMDKKSDTYAIALGSSIAFGGLLTFEFYRIIPSVTMPFENNLLQQTYSYEMIKWAWVSFTNLCVAFVAAFMMETVRRRETRLRELVVRDALTGLYNWRYFIYRLHSEIQRAKRYGRTLSLLILDVDDFKKYNDEHGHLAGDALLRSLADILKAHIRRSDDKFSYEVDIACRYGGEEFAIILPESVSAQGMIAAERLRRCVEKIGAVSVAERIRKKIEEVHHGKVHMTVSIGVSSYPEHGVEIDSLVRAADDAMYLAKRKGKNRVVVAGGDARVGTPAGAPHG
ncbi:MAG: GGDEF domain-containing protein [Candidatus Deferrimicrobiaceae bacterium]